MIVFNRLVLTLSCVNGYFVCMSSPQKTERAPKVCSAHFVRIIFLILTAILPISLNGQATTPSKTAPRKSSTVSRTPAQKKATPKPQQNENVLQQHFEAAQQFQSSGNTERAVTEYHAFIVQALRRLAIGRGNAGDPATAMRRIEEAFIFGSEDNDLNLDYAEACIATGESSKARSSAEKVVKSDPRNARARFLLAKILSSLNEDDAAMKNFELSVGLEPNFEHGYALSSQYLKMKNLKQAAKVFREMKQSFGDGAALHMAIGTAYAMAGYPEQGIQEFKLALAKNPRLPGLHYSLGAAYIGGLENAAFPQAEAEFREELKLYPNDPLSRHQLGYITLTEKKYAEAETQLTKAQELDPDNPDIALLLGQLYTETNRLPEAEQSLRKCIALTTDVSRGHYQVQRAHYLLARLLIRTKRAEEAKNEMAISDQLLKLSVSANQGKTGVSDQPTSAAESRGTPNNIEWKTNQATTNKDAVALGKVEAFEQQIAPAIADSYNNLGVISASNKDAMSALEYFRRAAAWDPSLEGIDFNLGKAAFQAAQFPEAIGPLTRYLHEHPDDRWARGALSVSLFAIRDYADVLRVLQPIESEIGNSSDLRYAYAVSLVKAGDAAKGIEWLKELETSSPNALIYIALGDAYAGKKEITSATDEYKKALVIMPSPDIYYRLGKVQLEQGDIKTAITSLEAGVKLGPENELLHYELSNAYRRDSRLEDADREMKLYEQIKGQHSASDQNPKPDHP